MVNDLGFLVYWKYFCRAKVKNKGSYGSVTFPMIRQIMNIEVFGDVIQLKLGLTGAPMKQDNVSSILGNPISKSFSKKHLKM